MKQIPLTLLVWLFLLALPARAQWLTQTLNLKQGWNAVFLHVDSGYATVDELIGAAAPLVTPIEQVWRWDPKPTTAQFIISPQQPIDTGSQWVSWKRASGSGSALRRLAGNTAYLVYSTTDYTWELKGRPVLPSYQWSVSGLNFFGFPTVPTSPPSFDQFLAGVPSLQLGEIFRYNGGELSSDNPARIFAFRSIPVVRGEAYWIRAGEVYNSYYGPFEVTATGNGQIQFGDSLNSYSFRLRNLTSSPLTVTLKLKESESAPAGQTPIAGLPPLLVRGEQNQTNLTYTYSELTLGASQSWTLAPQGQQGSETEVVIGLDRVQVTGAPTDLLAGLLELTDSLGQTRIDLAVSAEVSVPTGLWVGAAAVTSVGQYLQSYLRDANNQLVVNTNGAYVVTGIITNLTPVPTAYPLRIIVHNPDSGPATLWQRIFFGYNATTNPIVANQESALAPNLISQARRLSASHLPWSKANPGWSFSGPLAQGAVVKASITNDFRDQASNPFLHTYHPDHDNLNASFRNELPQGSESYTIVREITLSVDPPADDFNSRVNASANLSGRYLESIRVQGLARAGNTFDARRFDVSGAFSLNRISGIPTLTLVP
ncbi:MAG: hypothetical protein J0M24_03975 [Verrucomicrobia bacterium]|nr:hypothetical protein [Verrucomicrobiota bacterium]